MAGIASCNRSSPAKRMAQSSIQSLRWLSVQDRQDFGRGEFRVPSQGFDQMIGKVEIIGNFVQLVTAVAEGFEFVPKFFG